MKKLIITALFAIGTGTANAQAVEIGKEVLKGIGSKLGIGVGGGEVEELKELNKKMEKLNSTSWDYKIDNYETRMLHTEANRLNEEIEKSYWIVDNYVKRGVEMKNIISLEKDIIKKLRELRNIANNLNYRERSSILSSTNNTLNTVGNYVDTAVGIATDNQYRMSNEERRKYLQEIESSLSGISSELNAKISSTKSYSYYKADSEKRKQDFDSAIKYQREAQRRLKQQKK